MYLKSRRGRGIPLRSKRSEWGTLSELASNTSKPSDTNRHLSWTSASNAQLRRNLCAFLPRIMASSSSNRLGANGYGFPAPLTPSTLSAREIPRQSLPNNVIRLPATSQLEACLTIIRDEKTSRSDFIFYSDRIIRLLVEEGLNHLPVVERSVTTPTGLPYHGECTGLKGESKC